MCEMRVQNNLIGKSQRKTPLEKPSSRWKDTLVDLRELECKFADWIVAKFQIEAILNDNNNSKLHSQKNSAQIKFGECLLLLSPKSFISPPPT
jgi:hypothetical protein